MADTQQVEEVSVGTPVGGALGAVLQAARNEKKLSQQDVSDSLRYSVKQIDALERDSFDLLPDAMITRGFIRNYARLLEIDAAPLLDIYRQLTPTQSPSQLGINASMQPVQLTKDSQPWLIYILGSILVLFFLLAWFVYLEYLPDQFKLQGDGAQQATTKLALESTAVDIPQDLEISLPEVALPAAERQSEDAPLTAEGVATTSQPVVNQQSQPTQQTNAPSQQVTPLPIAEPITPAKSESAIKTEPKASSLAAKKVSMTVTEETWVRVSDKAGQVLYEATLSAGDTQLLSFQPPFNVVVGNAKAATVSVSGQAVDLAGYTRNNIARISLE